MQESDAFLALGAADIVFTTGETVFHAGITDHQAEGVGDGNVGGFEGSAIEEDGMAGLGMGGDELVHDPAVGAGEMVFGSLSGEGETAEVRGMTGGGEEGEAEAHFEGGGRAQAGAEGDLPGEPDIGSLEFEAIGFQFHGDASEVITPVVLERGAWIIEIHDDGFPKVVGVGMEEAIGAWGEGGMDREMDGGGEDEAVVVIGMFADEVDTTWGAGEEGGWAMVGMVEGVDGLGRRHGGSLAGEGDGGNPGGRSRGGREALGVVRVEGVGMPAGMDGRGIRLPEEVWGGHVMSVTLRGGTGCGCGASCPG